MQISKCKNCAFVFYSNELEYCENCYHLTSSFGCLAIRKGEYMILNKQYTKEEYYELKNKIDEQMKKEGTFGQYFPAILAPFSYNEALSQDFFPLQKEEALKRGFSWQEKTTGTYGKETIKKDEVPNAIESVDENILKEIFQLPHRTLDGFGVLQNHDLHQETACICDQSLFASWPQQSVPIQLALLWDHWRPVQ